MPVQVFSPAVALNTDDANLNTNFRTFVQLSGGSNGAIRVIFRASSTTDMNIQGASFGKWDGNALSGTGGDMTLPAFRLTFGSVNTVTVPAGSIATSDFITHTGLSLGTNDWLIVAWYNTTPAGERFSTGGATATSMFTATATDFSQAQTVSSTGATWNVVGSKQPGDSGGSDYIVDSVETIDPPAPAPFAGGARKIFI